MTDDELTAIRGRIDELDRRIIALLAERETFVRRAGRLKTDAGAVRAPDRVAQLVRRARSTATELGASPDVVERTYRAMIGAFIDLELAAVGMTGAPPIEPVRPGDAGELLTLQRAAYATEARIYGDPGLPPLVQTLDELTEELERGLAFKVTHGHRIVGAVRGRVEDDLLRIGRLTVAPDFQGRGLGTALLAAIEESVTPAVRHATLFTGHLSAANLRLYERLGYAEERREPLRPGVELVHLTKRLA
ncbi:GNAT family N-acetyltransferase [Actinoallomurus spadix]|uniref:Chorismate mutase n=1 Tax=Actinoallomurus spadix TaxID=79912 RepID=A0ABN0XL58_9ACTN|nr:GNAT family N-acetyltransferase [Actinoallomurus spadix]MCO5985039.1 GNAT family N-acetyltransferase [Actinoallomurus spadix]